MQTSPSDSRAKRLATLFGTFFKIGAFTFGGGYAMIPLIQREVVEHHGWISDDDVLEIVAVAESTPGPVAINMATFVGWRTAGVLGAVAATLGVVLPSFLIILVLSYVLEAFQHLKAVRYAFWGIRAGVLALILKALWSLAKRCPKHWFSYAIAGAAFVAATVLGIPLLAIIIACAVLGLVYTLLTAKGGNRP